MNNSTPKQVIVMRKDLNMRKGKMIAQGAHASMAVLLAMMNERRDEGYVQRTFSYQENSPIDMWLSEKFTKICVSVTSEQELLDIHQKAKELNIPTALITDSGQTEFNGVPTNTCCAIGPSNAEDINKITGHLSLL